MIQESRILKAIVVLLLLVILKPALAVVPPTLNYQAYLTDDNGLPIDGTADVTVSIYNVEVGSVALWSETRTGTAVSNGVFSVELGSIVPFPPGLFEMPLWLGVTVDADSEMTPRRPISSTGFAFKASDADTLEGISAASLDQSAHVVDTSNPHNVTTTQIGAVSSDDLTAHASDSSAHHTRTSSFTELSGQIDDAQIPALIARDAEIMPTVLSSDGPGSTLDADLLDGLSSSAFMPSTTDLWVNTTGDTMTGDLSSRASIGISTYGITPQYPLDVRRGIDSYLGFFFNDNSVGSITSGIYSFADGRDTGTGNAYGATITGWGGSAAGTAYGIDIEARANGSSSAYAVYADATQGETTGREYAFYGLGQGYFSDNVGIGHPPDTETRLWVSGGVPSLVYIFNNNDFADSNTFGIEVSADGEDTDTGDAYGVSVLAIGGGTNGFATGINSQAITRGVAHARGSRNWAAATGGGSAYGTLSYAETDGSLNAYAVYADATYGTTTGTEYAFYGIGEGYFSQDLRVDGAVQMGFERVTGSAVSLTATASCGFSNSGICYYTTATVACPTGKVATGGGCNCSSSYNCFIADSYQSADSSWFCRAVAAASGSTITPSITCARMAD